MKKSKSDYFENLNEKNINDNKIFWKTIKSFLSAKVTSTNKTTLRYRVKIIVGDYNTAKVLNTSNIVSDLNIAEYSNCEPFTNNISDPAFKICCKIYEPSQHTSL